VQVAGIFVLALSSVWSIHAQENNEAAQAIIVYGFLVEHYPNDFLVASHATAPLVKDMSLLASALDSIHCDVPTRLAFPHRAIVVPSSAADRWLGFRRLDKNRVQDGSLFVIEYSRSGSQRILVVLSSLGPARTTVFWVEKSEGGYVGKLVYDSFKKEELANETTLGATAEVKLANNNDVLIKELVEVGSGPLRWQFAKGRVFRVDLRGGTIKQLAP